MYLKKIEIQGFKSFADKISLDFSSGITSIVGPNGSGKSNIADAVRWVLGEQSAKTLRGSKMEDVIFSGTQHRKPLGFSDVSLTIDNSDNKLPVEYSEVTVTRRVFRSGESEYYINKNSCRLKDIHALFFDTGIGKDGYSIIGQGRIDEILSTKSEDRRHIFEEASGIMKYKVRKIEAERKLESTRQNLVRINDIINELFIQLEPLKEQSEKARKFISLREKLKGIEVSLYLVNIERFKERLKEYDSRIETINENINTENGNLEKMRIEINQKNTLLAKLEEKLESARKNFYELEGRLEKSSSQIKINEQKIQNLEDNIERLENESKESMERINELNSEQASRKKKLEYLEQQHEKFLQRLDEFEGRLRSILSNLDEAERSIEIMKADMMEKTDMISDKKLQLNSVGHHVEALEKRKSDIETEIRKARFEIDKEKMTIEELNESLYKTEENIRKFKSCLAELNTSKKEHEESLDTLKRQQSNMRSELQVKTSRFRMLEEMEERLEGYGKSVRGLLLVCEQQPQLAKGIHGALAQLLTVDLQYETAIEMALGGALQNIVTDTEEDAKRAIEFLKEKRMGRVTFLPISSVKGKSIDDDTKRKLKQNKGYIGIASELVECERNFSRIVGNLLGRVAVVDNLDSGISIARQFKYLFRIVTLEGDVINPSGAMSGGSRPNNGSGLLGRHREVEELKAQVDKMKNEYSRLKKSVEDKIRLIEGLNESIRNNETMLKDQEIIKIRDESHALKINETIEKLNARIEMLGEECKQTEREKHDTARELDKYKKEIQGLQFKVDEQNKKIEEFRTRHKEDQTARDELHMDITDHKVSVGSIAENIEAVKEVIERIDTDKQALEQSIGKKAEVKGKNMKSIEELKEKNAGLYVLIKKFDQEKQGRTFEMDRISEEKKMLAEELEGIGIRINEINEIVMSLKEDFNRVEVRKARSESEMDAIQNRLWDEYELTYNNAREYRQEIESIAFAQRVIDSIRKEIKELGPVNVAAIDDYVKTKERFEFMTGQKNDMEKAETKLQRVIQEMTSIMKKKFLEQFKIINRNFNEVFQELFDGGKAELRLVDDRNVLETGIEIEVQPPGKKLQNMLLLSGGERALTAIVLLFAILRMNPTPFCLLDEIEAALDDVNVYRFAEYLRKYSAETQFIMVTHRKGTMEASDTLYGVTMEEHGVSKIVSLKVGEREAV